MTTQRQTMLGNLSATRGANRPAVNKYPGRRFPIQHEIHQLQEQLNAFNERIADLKDVGHRGHAMEVLKSNAIDFPRPVYELHCFLAVSLPNLPPTSRPNPPYPQ